ncbi:hypothetical protein R5R35_011173 [Gryllus longicercus]|uniref:Uncharacterized protein n=1 Tax=Gryllus longicercus TaxID=2509291 RepID=A0AAN9Z5I0_9ORTH
MLHISSDNSSRNGYLKKSPLTFISNLFKKKKYHDDISDVNFEEPTFKAMDHGSECRLTAVDIMVQAPCCPPSPAASTLTLTPGRTRDIDQDMAALRLSRQDNPFLQVLASRESLVDSMEESESDDANLMSQEFPHDLDVDPLTLPEIHEHMIRSPPPVTWPKSPNFKVFRFPLQSSDEESSQESIHHCGKKTPKKVLSPKQSQSKGSLNDCLRELSAEALSAANQMGLPARLGVSPRPHQRSSSEVRDKSSNPFAILKPEVQRLHARGSDDSVQLVSKTDEQEHHVGLPLLLAKRPA